MEFLELAEYDGQSAKHIDWNASVRSGKTKVRHYVADHDVRVWILSDIGATFGFGRKWATKADLAKEMIETIGKSAQSQWNSIGVCLFDEKRVNVFPPSRSPWLLREATKAFSKLSDTITSQSRIESIIKLLPSYKIGNSPLILLVDTSFSLTPAFVALCQKHKVFVLFLCDNIELYGQWTLRDANGNSISLAKEGIEKEKHIQEFLRSISQKGAFGEMLISGEPFISKLISLFHRANGKISS